MLCLPSTRLTLPAIVYGNNETRLANNDKANWNLAPSKAGSVPKFMASPGDTKTFRYWILAAQDLVDRRSVAEYRAAFEKQIQRYNICNIELLDTGFIPGRWNDLERQTWDATQTLLENTMTTMFKNGKAKNPAFEPPNLVLLLLRKKDLAFYTAFKDLADRRFGVKSICVTEQKNLAFNKKSCKVHTDDGFVQYMANVMMKANLKWGGINHTACDSVQGKQQQGHLSQTLSDTLVLGADVTHPSPGSLPGCPSIAAVVGSCHSSGGKFLGSMRLQEKSKEEVRPAITHG